MDKLIQSYMPNYVEAMNLCKIFGWVLLKVNVEDGTMTYYDEGALKNSSIAEVKENLWNIPKKVSNIG